MMARTCTTLPRTVYSTSVDHVLIADAVEKNKKGNLISHISPQFCDLNKHGEIVFIDYENSTVHKINPSNREKDKEILAEGIKKAFYLYE